MVKLEEVVDEEFLRAQQGPDEDDWDTDSDSDSDSVISLSPDETLYERITALQDIIPASYRHAFNTKVSTAKSWVTNGLMMGGKTLWVVSTSALLLGVPWALAYAEEQQVQEMEREMKMQQNATDFLTPGATTQAAQAKPAL